MKNISKKITGKRYFFLDYLRMIYDMYLKVARPYRSVTI